jgi:hypothetical protein
MKQKFQPGDRVKFAVTFLRSTGQYYGDPAPCSSGPFARGTVDEVLELEFGRQAVYVVWDDGDRHGAINSDLCLEDKAELA